MFQNIKYLITNYLCFLAVQERNVKPQQKPCQNNMSDSLSSNMVYNSLLKTFVGTFAQGEETNIMFNKSPQ